MTRANLIGTLALLGAGLSGCSNTVAPISAPPRAFRLGFSATPPRLTTESALQTIEAWRPRGDIAQITQDVPWRALLADSGAALLVRRNLQALAALYHGRGLPIIVQLDVTNGLSRDREAPELIALGRSIVEPAIQALYREYVAAVDSIVHPEYLGLAMETNLIRTDSPPEVYAAIVRMTAAGDAALVAQGSTAKRFVSVQVETAWGRLPDVGRFVGIETERADFPFIGAIGLSSYPFLGGFAEPEEVPEDYYARLNESGAPALPMLVVEGGWTSASMPGVPPSPDRQARWIARQMELADRAGLVAVTQISYTDLDLSTYPASARASLAPFAELGLVDSALQPKPALAVWDEAFSRPLRR